MLVSEFNNLSVLDLLSLIQRAEDELERRKHASKETLRQEIEEKLKGTGLNLADLFPDAVSQSRRKRNSEPSERKPVLPKYRDPVSQETWSGRGARPPRWVVDIMSQRGWTLNEFKQSGEYDA